MNPIFTLSIDLEKRKISATGLVAVGEKVDVVVKGVDYSSIPVWETDNIEGFIGPALRFRLVTPEGKDLVRFPLAKGDAWNKNGDSLSAEVDFNTMQLRDWLRGFPIAEKAEVGIIIDSVVDAMEYGRGTVKILQWVASPAEDPTILPDWRKTLRELNAAIVEISYKSEQAVNAATLAEYAKELAQKYVDSANVAANNALKSENEAKRFRNESLTAEQSASASANDARGARAAAESAKVAAETARDEAREHAESAKVELQAEVERATMAEAQIDSKINTIIADDAGKSARTIAAEEVAKVVADAPADFDTLKEIAEYIESDKTGAAQMVTKIDANAEAISAEATRAQEAEAALRRTVEGKVDAEAGKGLSTNDYTNEDKAKLGTAYTPANPPPAPDLSGYAKTDEVIPRKVEGHWEAEANHLGLRLRHSDGYGERSVTIMPDGFTVDNAKKNIFLHMGGLHVGERGYQEDAIIYNGRSIFFPSVSKDETFAVKSDIESATNNIQQLFNNYISATNDNFVAAVNASQVSVDDSVVAEIAEYAGVDVPTAGATSIGALSIVILGGLSALKLKKQDALSQEQMVAVNSGITADKVSKLEGIEAGAQKNPDLSGYATKSEIPYSLIEVPLADRINLTDRAVNKVTADGSLNNIQFVFPEKKEGKSRDFFLRLVITGETVPTLSFSEPNGDSVSFDADYDSWADIEQGVNILMFTDTEE